MHSGKATMPVFTFMTVRAASKWHIAPGYVEVCILLDLCQDALRKAFLTAFKMLLSQENTV